MNPLYANKETRDRLGDKSKLVYGARGRWRKRAMLNGANIKEMEAAMDVLIDLQTKSIDEQKKVIKDLKEKAK